MRFTMLKSRLIRIEFTPEQVLEDRPTKCFGIAPPVPEFQTYDKDGNNHRDSGFNLTNRLGEPPMARFIRISVSKRMVYLELRRSRPPNLRGTARTLAAPTALPLEKGLVSRSLELIDTAIPSFSPVMQPLTARDRSRYAVWVLFSLWT
jgi:hypothetical protein